MTSWQGPPDIGNTQRVSPLDGPGSCEGRWVLYMPTGRADWHIGTVAQPFERGNV